MEKIIYTNADWKKGSVSHIPKGTPCLFDGTIDANGFLIVRPKNKKGEFYLSRHLPKDLFDLKSL